MDMKASGLPNTQGLYDPSNEHDNCGVGFICNIKNKKSHEIITQGLQILVNMDHRGAVGADPLAGDGAGIIMQIPHDMLVEECAKLGFELPEVGEYAVGQVFLPRDEAARKACLQAFDTVVPREGQELLGWRSVPVDNSCLGESVKAAEPEIRQVFIKKGANVADEAAFERKLFVIRKQVHHVVWDKLGDDSHGNFYIPTLSARTIVYKGMVLSSNLGNFYLDLQDPRTTSALALVHQRFSTNTFPSWELAQPFRYLCHNGEINTVRGNINWMAARKATMSSDVLGDDLDKLWPLIGDGSSDSATFDNALELLVAGGYSLSHAMMMMIPEAWDNNPLMDDERRAFYEYHAALMEPWDGPAAVCFTDGRQIGATLDRNGLRPARYVVTDDDFVIMGSEVGVIPVDESKIVKKWRLQPGKMFLIDLVEGRIIDDEEIKSSLTQAKPYQEWLDRTQIKVEDLPDENPAMAPDHDTLLEAQQAFGYTQEDYKHFIKPMALTGQDPIGSMGRDTPIAVLSERPKILYDYFTQNFAQVTNPPIDPIREELVMSLVSLIGPRPNLMNVNRIGTRKRLEVRQPILTNLDLEKIRHIENHVDKGFKTYTLSMCYPADQGAEGMEAALDKLFAKAEKVVNEGYNILILSDRRLDANHIAIPALLATAGVHHHLIRTGQRTSAGLVVETGEARRVHDFCLLGGYGAEAINPYLAFDTIVDFADELPDDVTIEEAQKRYVKAVDKGMLKVFSKMGISTFQSYCGAQIFDAIGLNATLIDRYFTKTASKIGGIGLLELATETARRHRAAFGNDPLLKHHLDVGGELAWRHRGEAHAWTPETISLLQHAVRKSDRATYRQYESAMNAHDVKVQNLRGLFKLNGTGKSVPLDEVEPIEDICKRFASGAMSFGSISWEAHTNIAIAMNRIGAKSNTGEGGEEAVRFTPLENGDSMRSAIKQVASGRFGVTAEYLVNADDIQIKMAQGAKPGEGGQLPGHKVNEWIGRVRHSTPGVGLISPPPHHDIYSIEDLAQLIHDLKNINPKARISVKLVSEVGVGTVAAGVSKAYADHVTISGFDGGTGASPLTSTQHAGGPWEIGLAETHQTLVMNKLRGRIAVQVDGGLRTARDVVVGALLGADEFGFATGALIAQGCLMMRKCHLNTCPVGIATQDSELRKLFPGEPGHVVNFFTFMAEEVRVLMAELGFRTINEMIGRSDAIEMNTAIDHWKAQGLDFTNLLHKPVADAGVSIYNTETQNHGLDKALDNGLITQAQDAIENGTPVKISSQLINVNRTFGTMLSGRVAMKYGKAGLPEDTIFIDAVGTAGQSLGAWLSPGITIDLKGDANDYVGKGLAGGRIIVRPADNSTLVAEDNMIAGNTCLYGATSGEAYLSGIAGERFAVRNSGATTVVEGVGDHGCEYMTGGIVCVLGATGRNFAAGMSGGIAYVLDEAGDFESRCNLAQVDLEPIKAEDDQMEAEGQSGDLEGHGRVNIEHDMTRYDAQRLKDLVESHVHYTNSARGRHILQNWDTYLPKFVKVMPVDYRRALLEMQAKDRAAEHNGVNTSVGN